MTDDSAAQPLDWTWHTDPGMASAYRPSTLAIWRAALQDEDGWGAFAARHQFPPLTSDGDLAAAWLGERAIARARRGASLAPVTLRNAAKGLDHFLQWHDLPPVSGKTAVKQVLAKARAGRSRGPGPSPLTPALGRVVLALAAPAPAAGVVRARIVLQHAFDHRLDVPVAAQQVARRDGWDRDHHHNAVAAVTRTSRRFGQVLMQRPADLDADEINRALQWLDIPALRHQGVLTGMTLGWHLGLNPFDLGALRRGQIGDVDKDVVEIDLGDSAYADQAFRAPRILLSAREPVLCAVARLRSWLWILGPATEDSSPLFPRVTHNPLLTPLSYSAWTHGISSAGAAAGLCLGPSSLRDGYLVTAAAQGVPLEEIAVGLRVSSLTEVAAKAARLSGHVRQAAAPSPRGLETRT